MHKQRRRDSLCLTVQYGRCGADGQTVQMTARQPFTDVWQGDNEFDQ